MQIANGAMFQDENDGSGFDVQRYVLIQDGNPPATDSNLWSSWSNKHVQCWRD